MKKLLSLLTLIIANIGFAQDNLEELNAFGRVNLGLHGLELTYELPVANSFVWENSIGLGMGFSLYDNDVNYTFILEDPVPYFTSELKYMYNRKKRIKKGRSTINNSGNYIGLQTKYSFGDNRFIDFSKTLLTEFHWGIQRPLGKRFLFDMHLGLGYMQDFDFDRGKLTPTLGFRLGYILFRNK